MKNLTKPSLLLVLLALSLNVNTANAAINYIDLGTVTGPLFVWTPGISGWSTNGAPTSSTTDYVNFTIGSGSSYNAIVGLLFPSQSISIESLTLKGGTLSNKLSDHTSPYIIGSLQNPTILGPGDYILDFNYDCPNGCNRGSYHPFLSLFNEQSVSAVPEPESYAMLLAGLGFLGFTMRSRKSNKT
jgi:hypothetical protein